MNFKSKLLFMMAILTVTSGYAQTDYTSKVPKFEFGQTLEEQENQLKTNSLIHRFDQSRRSLVKNRYRPYYHYINPEGKLNDPNGLCFWKGNWHLFYQAYPPEDPRQHWGHAVSNDLTHWRDLPYAIYPNPEQMVFSGSTFVEDDRVIAMYHGVSLGSMVAVSSDPLLLNWEKISGTAVIPHAKPGETLPYSVWDPNIWKEGDYYYSTTGGRIPEGPGGKEMRNNFLFRSSDLKNWEYLHPFVENDHYSLVGDDGSCPYFWPIGNKGKYILLYFSHMSGGKYLIGDYDKKRDKFVVTDGGDFNHGPVSRGGVHAPSACPDGKGGVIAIFNMNTAIPVGDGNYTELMTLPRLLTLDENDKLAMKPAGAIESLRGRKTAVPAMELPANKEIVVEEVSGDAIELDLTVNLQESTAFELNVLRSAQKEEYTRIVFYKDGGYPDREYSVSRPRYSAVTIDNLNSSVSGQVQARIPEVANVLVKENEPVKLQVFVDRSIVEVFVNDRQCIALRTYPQREDSKGISVKAHGSASRLERLDAWQMKNLYRKE